MTSQFASQATDDAAAIQVVIFAHDDESPQPAIVLVERDLRAEPDHVSLAPTWEQTDFISARLGQRDFQDVWDMTLATGERSAMLGVQPQHHGSVVALTAVEFEPTSSYHIVISAEAARAMSSALRSARSEFAPISV